MYVVASDSRQISSVSGCFGWFLNHGKVTEFRDGNGKSPKIQ